MKTTLSNSGTICFGLKEPNDPPIIMVKQGKCTECWLERVGISHMCACIIKNNNSSQVDEMLAILDKDICDFDK